MTVKAHSDVLPEQPSRPRRRRGSAAGTNVELVPPAVIDLTELRASDVGRAGGKAAVLGTLAEAGFPVPAGFVVATEVFREALAPFTDAVRAVLDGPDLKDPARAAEAAAEIARALADLSVPAGAARLVRDALDRLGDGPLAVRSSAMAEDREDASFAGQYETIVGVRGERDVLGAIVVCWRSYFAVGALAERAARGGGPDDAMAVLVQRVVDAECAGVAFSVDPVQGRRDLVVVEAAWGLGIGTVDGSVEADSYWVRREGREPERKQIVDKPERIALAPEGGVRREQVAPEQRGSACLPDAWLARVAGAALMTEALLGRPQDIEWAISEGQLWVLQSRPIAALAPELRAPAGFPVLWPDDQHRRGSWSLGSPSLSSPLEQDCLEDLFAAAWRDAQALTGHERETRGLRLHGRLYSRGFPSSLSAGDRRTRKAAQQDLQRRLERDGRTFWEHWGPEIVLATERLRDLDGAAADGPGLADHLEDAMGAFRRHWTVHWQLWAEGMHEPFEQAFRKLTGREGPEAGQDAAMLLEGEDTSFTRMMDALHAVAVAARETPGAPAILRDAGSDAARRLRALPDGRAAGALEAFLADFGGRIGSGFNSRVTLRTPCWREDPAVPLSLAAAYLEPDFPSPAEARAVARAARDLEVERLCAACEDPAAVAQFRRLLAYFRQVQTVLEDHNHFIDQLTFSQLREAIVAAGGQLAARGSIETADDVFWLRAAEVLGALRATDAPDLRALVLERQEEHAALEALEAPPLLGAPDPKLPPRPPFKHELTPLEDDGGPLVRGQAASPGRRRGRARVVPTSVLRPDLRPSDVLVAQSSSPCWTPLFPMLAGVVLDQGVLTQHSATTAREYGIPAVFRTGHATRRIPDGAWVIVDGTAGTVEIDEAQFGSPNA